MKNFLSIIPYSNIFDKFIKIFTHENNTHLLVNLINFSIDANDCDLGFRKTWIIFITGGLGGFFIQTINHLTLPSSSNINANTNYYPVGINAATFAFQGAKFIKNIQKLMKLKENDHDNFVSIIKSLTWTLINLTTEFIQLFYFDKENLDFIVNSSNILGFLTGFVLTYKII
jgi:hypothetical protein